MKINCAECLKGNCSNCKSEECLCRESHKSICKQCKKKESIGGIIYGDFCGNDCQIKWALTSPDAINEKFSTEAKLQVLVTYLKQHKKYRDIVYSIKSNPGMTFNFNVLENNIINYWFIQDAENFPLLVKSAVLKAFQDYGGEMGLITIAGRQLKVVITDATGIKMNEWSADHEGIPLQVECQVIAAGMAETYTKSGEAYCPSCNNRKEITSLGMIPKCGAKDCEKKTLDMIIDWSTVKTGDIKVFRIQEPIDQARHGTPVSFPLTVKDEAVKNTFVGQRKKVIGVFRSQIQKGKQTNSIMINAISLTDMDDAKDIEPDDEMISFFHKLRKKKDFLDIVTESIAPELKHEKLAKLCVLLACVGGTPVGRLRGDIHGILVGSPSAGKSTLLEYIPMFNQKSGFASGSTMSGTSVTASMDTLPNRERIVRAGIISLCTGGIVAIDEMNQLTPEDLAKMFEAMETGKIHYNKGGFDVTLDARTTIMGGANPKGYEYDYNDSMIDNLSFMPPPMISRFDLITLMTSQKDEEKEVEIEKHILLIRKIGVEEYIKREGLLTTTQMMLFINHVKKIKPIPDPKTEKILLDFSASMRKLQSVQKGMRRVDKRFFESMIRISTAIAKIHMSDIVSEEHAVLAIEIYKQNLNTFGIDTSEGVTVHKQEKFVHGKQSAFEVYCRKLESVSEDHRFTEAECVSGVVEIYPDYFQSTDVSQKMFDEYYNKGKLDKKGGRYRLE